MLQKYFGGKTNPALGVFYIEKENASTFFVK